jgi:hypothetical protein
MGNHDSYSDYEVSAVSRQPSGGQAKDACPTRHGSLSGAYLLNHPAQHLVVELTRLRLESPEL